jgi:hypothetical protein
MRVHLRQSTGSSATCDFTLYQLWERYSSVSQRGLAVSLPKSLRPITGSQVLVWPLGHSILGHHLGHHLGHNLGQNLN